MKRLLPFLGLAWLATALAEDAPSPGTEAPPAWKIDPAPALAPGSIGEWDDFAIGAVSVVRLPDKWIMLYEGIALSDEGRSQGFGVAESPDGVTWRKHPGNPALGGDPALPEFVAAPSMTRWRDALWALYTSRRSLFRQEATLDEFGLPRTQLVLGRLDREMAWDASDAEQEFPSEIVASPPARPSFYAESSGNIRHLWWLGAREADPALFHSVSRDGRSWSKPNHQLASQIDPRPICCARVHESGDFYILVCIARDQREWRVVVKTSSNARSWTAAGPPEFRLASHSPHVAPWVVFTPEGARLYFAEQHEKKGSILRTAFCPKSAYLGR